MKHTFLADQTSHAICVCDLYFSWPYISRHLCMSFILQLTIHLMPSVYVIYTSADQTSHAICVCHFYFSWPNISCHLCMSFIVQLTIHLTPSVYVIYTSADHTSHATCVCHRHRMPSKIRHPPSFLLLKYHPAWLWISYLRHPTTCVVSFLKLGL